MFVFLHSLNYFDFIGLNVKIYGYLTYLLDLLLIIAVVLFYRRDYYSYTSFLAISLLSVPLLSFIPCLIENGQSPIESLKAFSSYFLFLVYFILHEAKIKENELVLALTVFAVVRILILVIQQFTYPDYMFSFRPEGFDDNLGRYVQMERRSGLYRFYIEDTYLSMFLVFYYFEKIIKHYSPKFLILFLIGLVGVYIDQSRQFMLSTAVAFAFVVLLLSGKRTRIISIVVLSILALFFVAFSSSLFGELSEMTVEDMNEDNIRVLAYVTFLFEVWGGPLSVIFGNGPVGNSAYGTQIASLASDFGLYRADVGIVGAMNAYGIVTVLVLVAVYVVLLVKYGKKLPIHIKMYIVAAIVNLPLVTVYTQRANWFVFMAFMLYLSDLGIAKYEFIKAKNIRKSVSS